MKKTILILLTFILNSCYTNNRIESRFYTNRKEICKFSVFVDGYERTFEDSCKCYKMGQKINIQK